MFFEHAPQFFIGILFKSTDGIYGYMQLLCNLLIGIALKTKQYDFPGLFCQLIHGFMNQLISFFLDHLIAEKNFTFLFLKFNMLFDDPKMFQLV